MVLVLEQQLRLVTASVWASVLDTLGHQVRVAGGEQVYEGFAKGVDEDGGLVLRLSDGSLRTFAAGEVTLRT